MKIKPSYYVLVAEIIAITLFHVVKFRQAERRPAEMDFTKTYRTLSPRQPIAENKTVMDYAIENLFK